MPYIDDQSDFVTNASGDVLEDLNEFIAHYKNNKDRYDAVAKLADIPTILLAAIHWREAGGDFSTYLSQGDKLGQRTWANGDSNNGVSLPDGTLDTILYTDWDSAAVFAIEHEKTAKAASGITYNEEKFGDMLIFSMHYNGMGYQERGLPDPYNLSGTTGYTKGKYGSDGHFNPDLVDEQVGILPMIRAVQDL